MYELAFMNESRNVQVLINTQTGAGISTSAGIPDFRSPDTGLYANLARLNLPYAEAVFDISYFRQNPLPFYTLAHELYPGKYRPTISHSFIRLLSDKGLLLKLFTQNIDCLEREAGVPERHIVEAHGSFAKQQCIECHTAYPDDLMKEAIETKSVPHCITPQCNGLVKPMIVFFGEALPLEFARNRSLPSQADLCIVMGTSLSVQPFASLPDFCAEGCPRLLMNKERAGSLGCRADDVLLLGDCDDGARELADALGWLDELEELWKATNPRSALDTLAPVKKTKDEALEDEITKLTKDVDESLKMSNDHVAWVRDGLAKRELQEEKSDDTRAEPGQKTNGQLGAKDNDTPELSNGHQESSKANGVEWESDDDADEPIPIRGNGQSAAELDLVYPHIGD